MDTKPLSRSFIVKDLKSYQEIFLNSILEEKDSSELMAEINPIGELSSERVLNLYRDDYKARLVKAMEENFKSIWFVLGGEDYFEVVSNYIDSHPSSHRDLGEYGESFPSFLRQSECRENFPLIGELAQFEWDFWQIFHGEYKDYGDPFIGVSETLLAKAHFQFHPSLKTYSWELALYNIFKNRDNLEVTLGVLDCQRPQCLLIYKSESEVQVKELNPVQWCVMNHLLKGNSLSWALENSSLENPVLIQELFQFLRSSGLVIEVLL